MAFKENLSGGGYFGYKPNKGINNNNNLIPGAAPPPWRFKPTYLVKIIYFLHAQKERVAEMWQGYLKDSLVNNSNIYSDL